MRSLLSRTCCAQPLRWARLERVVQGGLVKEYETKIGTPGGVLSGFKLSAWTQMNDFTHTGFIQVSRRHKPGRVEANYPDQDLTNALGAAGALGLIAAGQLIAIAGRHDLLPKFMEKMTAYAKPSAAA